MTRRELREAERRTQLQADVASPAPLAFASRRERRQAERVQSTGADVATTTLPRARQMPTATHARPVPPVARVASAARLAPVAPAVVIDAPGLPAVVIPAGVATAPALTPVAELHDRPATESIELPPSFRRNEVALQPVSPARRGSNRAFVRVKRGAAAAGERRSTVVRGAAGLTALGFAATIAVATTLPAAAEHSQRSQAAVDAMIGDAGGAQTLTVGSSSAASIASAAADVDRAPSYAVATMGNATAYNVTFGVPRPDPNAYSNNLTAPVQWPFPTGVVISDHYGPRIAPCSSGCSSNHMGVDFTPGEGTPIGSIAAGTVVSVQATDNGGLGVHVIVEHVINGHKVQSVYGHMLTGSIPVQVGDVVQVGDELGRVGNTGSSTGAHLHLEIHIGGEKIDPYAFLGTHNVTTTVVDRPDAPVQA